MSRIKRSRIDSLTVDERAQFGPWARKWAAIGLRTGETDWAASEDAIARCYTLSGLQKPRFVRSTSPLAAVTAGPIAATILQQGDSVNDSVRDSVAGSVRDSVYDSVHSSVYNSVAGSVRASVRDSVRNSVYGSVDSSVYGSVNSSVYNSVYGSVNSSVHNSVAGSVRDSVRDSMHDSISGSVRDSWHQYLGGQLWSGWAAYLSFFTDVLGLDCGGDFVAKGDAWRDMTVASSWLWLGEDFVIVSPYPTHLHRDNLGRPHCETGKAIEWVDSFGVSSWHGTTIPDEWLTDKAALTSTVALTHKHIEQRRCAAEILGWDKVLKDPTLDTKTIDDDKNAQIGRLVEVDLPGSGRERFLIAECGTGRTFALPVPPDVRTAREANAWTYGVDDATDLEVRT